MPWRSGDIHGFFLSVEEEYIQDCGTSFDAFSKVASVWTIDHTDHTWKEESRLEAMIEEFPGLLTHMVFGQCGSTYETQDDELIRWHSDTGHIWSISRLHDF